MAFVSNDDQQRVLPFRHALLAGAQSREAIVFVRLTRQEKAELAEVARDMGLSLSAYARGVLLDRPLPPRRHRPAIPEVNRQLYVGLNRIGTNLNQMAERMNREEFPDRKEMFDILELLAQAIGDIKGELIGLAEVQGRHGEGK